MGAHRLVAEVEEKEPRALHLAASQSGIKAAQVLANSEEWGTLCHSYKESLMSTTR